MSEIAAVHNPGLAKAGKSFASHTCRRGSIMFAIWVVTLHLPRVLGLYGIPGAPHDPDEWSRSSLFIAVALWGGLWR
jgi:hypothetical protein